VLVTDIDGKYWQYRGRPQQFSAVATALTAAARARTLGPIEHMSIIEAITLAIAVLGAVLGLVNTWHAIEKTRVKIRVRPKHAIPVGAADPRITFCIEITNLSDFAITIDEAGVFYRGTDARGAYTQPILMDGKSWPRRLEPRSSVTVYGQSPQPKPGHSLKCAYARTECGVTRIGTSPAFKQLAASRT